MVFRPLSTLTAGILIVFSGAMAAAQTNTSDSAQIHREQLVRADESVKTAALQAQKDPLYPLFHLRTAANWINDPNGPIFFNGKYHMFFQHNPYGDMWGNMSWGHAVSSDMVTWKHLPIALAPNPGEYDKDGVFSGCCVIDNGVPTIVYTGVNPEVQCIARSNDGMKTWVKYSGNPVIPVRPRDDLEGFRDPFVWADPDGFWYAVIGSGIKNEGGTALLYRSKNLESWEFLNPLCISFGKNWECPNFFPLGGKHVLVVSPHSDVQYTTGTFDKRRFTPGQWRLMDLGGPEGFYAPNCLIDEHGRRIMWGWIRGGGTKGFPWNGMLTLPRVLTLRPDGSLGMEPLQELETLRGDRLYGGSFTLTEKGANPLAGIKGNRIEIVAEIDPGNCSTFTIDLLKSPDGVESASIVYDNAAQYISAGGKGGRFQLLPDEKRLKIHAFLDASVLEVFINGRECITVRAYPKNTDAAGIGMTCSGGDVVVGKCEIWQMNGIFED